MLQEKKKREIKRKMISPDLLWADSIPKNHQGFSANFLQHTFDFDKKDKKIQNVENK